MHLVLLFKKVWCGRYPTPCAQPGLRSHVNNPNIQGNCSHLREHARLGARAGRPRRVYEIKMLSLLEDM